MPRVGRVKMMTCTVMVRKLPVACVLATSLLAATLLLHCI